MILNPKTIKLSSGERFTIIKALSIAIDLEIKKRDRSAKDETIEECEDKIAFMLDLEKRFIEL